jgi:2-oxoglutarate ferredoxin oxidoreductase subunit alpha
MVIVPEINNGQLVKIIRSEFLIDAIPFNKIKGTPITQDELETFIKKQLLS